ncbi:DNA primase family protein [Mammaliicoccus sciuri]|uniref:DNA primase family protein n=1 Tax=Mammaliicoccus sciuri TaxID=1296 RepID=UPI0028851657|nr:phage/plasmid primase, P4 family [Mammaliicoccus sciuri]MDT0754004.1 phage/plasmid primase, P4 family [Mammaliicoccus sciuri]
MTIDHSLMEKLKNNAIEENINAFFEDKKFAHHKFSKYITKKYHIITLDNTLHIYHDGIYIHDELKIKQHIINEIPTLKQTQIRETLEYIRLIAPVKDHASPFFIPVLNGVYDFNSHTLVPHSPDIVVTAKFNASYEPKITSDIVDQALLTIADDDLEIVQLFTEIFGYLLFKQNFLDKSFLLVGNGGNGKSTLLNMMANFVGEENVSSVSLPGLSERFNLAELHNKLLNAGDDIPIQSIKDASNFKKLSTGERITAERKGQDPFQFRNYAKLVFSANAIPRWFENSNGIFDRLVLVPLNAQLRNNPKRDPFLEKKVTTDEARSHLLNLAIKALGQLLHRRKFTIPAVSSQKMEEFKEDNDPLLGFLSEVNLHERVVSEVYVDYQNWCEFEGYKFPLRRKDFINKILENGFEKKKIRNDNYDNPQWSFVNYMMKDK